MKLISRSATLVAVALAALVVVSFAIAVENKSESIDAASVIRSGSYKKCPNYCWVGSGYKINEKIKKACGGHTKRCKRKRSEKSNVYIEGRTCDCDHHSGPDNRRPYPNPDPHYGPAPRPGPDRYPQHPPAPYRRYAKCGEYVLSPDKHYSVAHVTLNMYVPSGTFVIAWYFYHIPDMMYLKCNGKIIFSSSGYAQGHGKEYVTYSGCDKIDVIITPKSSHSFWDIIASCP